MRFLQFFSGEALAFAKSVCKRLNDNWLFRVLASDVSSNRATFSKRRHMVWIGTFILLTFEKIGQPKLVHGSGSKLHYTLFRHWVDRFKIVLDSSVRKRSPIGLINWARVACQTVSWLVWCLGSVFMSRERRLVRVPPSGIELMFGRWPLGI